MLEEGQFPASFMQELTLTALDGVPSSQNLPIAWDLRGELRRDALESALAALQHRHEALRTSLHATETGVVQTVWPAADVMVTDVHLASGTSIGAVVGEIVARGLSDVFQLSRTPLWRVWLVQIAADHHVLIMIINHVMIDGWSCAILFRDLTRLYREAAGGRPTRANIKPQQFRHYATWERSFPWGQVPTGQHGAGELMIPAPSGWTENGQYDGHGRELPVLSAPAVRALTRVAEGVGASLGSALWAVVIVDVSMYARDTVALAATHANRERGRHYNTVGPLADQAILSVPVDRKMPFTELIRLVNQSWRAGLARFVPVGLLIKRLAARYGQTSRLFDLAVNYMPHAERVPTVVDDRRGGRVEVTWRSVSTLTARPRYPGNASAAKVGYHFRSREDGSVGGELWINRDAVRADVGIRLGASLPWLVEQVMDDGERRIGDLASSAVDL